MSQLTTHVLDTSCGRPAANVSVVCFHNSNGSWTEIAQGFTNSDGRLPNLFATGQALVPGLYKLQFHTKAYFDVLKVQSFYPYVDIVFEILDAAHYHVPLLLNPYGYSTYRGS